MNKVYLDNGWQFTYKEKQIVPVGEIVRPEPEEGEWFAASVPGDIHPVLLRAGKIADPHYDVQAKDCYWITSKDWWYRLDFDMPEISRTKTEIYFDGIDGYSDIWLNGEYIGSTENAFRRFRFDISKVIREAGNVLEIRLRSIDGLLGGPRVEDLRGWQGRRALLRKPQYNFGWDWALPLPSIGFIGKIWIETDHIYKIVDCAVKGFSTGRVDFFFEVNSAAKDKGYEISIKLKGDDTSIKENIVRNSFRSYVTLNVQNPRLWFPNGMGEPYLYDYKVDLIVDGEIKDTRTGKIGLRDVCIVEEPFTHDAGPGFSFWIEVNGTKVFCKGANWIPTELWPGSINPEDYAYYIKLSRDAGFNMLRVWGGGIYENDIFYNLCDQYGIMVWQDFMFSSTAYPVDLLEDEIIAEASYQIKRLRNHPCIVLWCGCNEDVHSWSYKPDVLADEQQDGEIYSSVNALVPEKYLDKQQDQGVYSQPANGLNINRLKDDARLYTMILRGLVSRYGLGIPYIESSPQSRDDSGNAPNSGNSHVSCWKYALFKSEKKYSQYRKHFENVCSFDSEFGLQGPSSIKTIRSFLKPENYWPPNDAWIYHIQRGHYLIPHHEQTMWIAGDIFGEIDSLEKYVKYGQAAHLEMMRSEFESARRDYPNNGGTMFWMLNDCWPTANWSVVDYYKRPKPAYYAAKRACQTLLPIVFERSGRVEFVFSNHSKGNVELKITCGQETLKGEKVWSETADCNIAPLNSRVIAAIDRKNLNIPLGDFLFIEAEANGKQLEKVTYFPDGWKGIKWPEPSIKTVFNDTKKIGGKYVTELCVSSDVYVRLLHFYIKDNSETPDFSDNYFDLPAQSCKTCIIESYYPIGPENLGISHWLGTWE
jgi:beta-mannosidase